MQQTAPERYNQAVVGILAEVIELMSQSGEAISDKNIRTEQLRKGMKLSRDLISEEGILLLSADQILDDLAIERIREIEFNLEEEFTVYVSQ